MPIHSFTPVFLSFFFFLTFVWREKSEVAEADACDERQKLFAKQTSAESK